jgi:AmmeMemoRadiSam system protein B
MRKVLIVFLSIISSMEMYSQTRSTDREPVAAGRFYTADKETLTRDLTKMFADCKRLKEIGNIRAVIAPHAGYVFSGKTAAAAFSATPKNTKIFS